MRWSIRRWRTLTSRQQGHRPGYACPKLGSRPHIRFGGQTLVATNARTGQAKTRLFPNIWITGASGWEFAALKSLFTGPANFRDIVSPGITQPIFPAGWLRAGVRVAEAVKQEALLTYKKYIQQAYQGVSDSLAGVCLLKEVRLESGKQVKALSQQTDLAYNSGDTPR